MNPIQKAVNNYSSRRSGVINEVIRRCLLLPEVEEISLRLIKADTLFPYTEIIVLYLRDDKHISYALSPAVFESYMTEGEMVESIMYDLSRIAKWV